MNYSGFIIFFISLGSAFQAFSQSVISGTVIDSLTSEPLSYVNIGIKNKNIGTAADENGNFNIRIPAEYVNDTLVISIVGYQDSRWPISLFGSDKEVIKLVEVVTQLSTVQITTGRLVERKFGIKNRNFVIHFSDGMFQENDVFEIGQLIKLKKSRAQITSVNLYLFDSERDSITFRINFYKINDRIPSERLIGKNIIQRHPVEQGWLRLDLSDENIVLEGEFVVALEFLPDKIEPNKRVFYEVKLGGSSRSYYRKNSQGNWNTPPHHYCMYVTALVDKNTTEEPEEIETVPVTSLWSKQVKDSFNIFLRLPADYEKKKKQFFPVIYCLDANAYFDHICQIVEDLLKKKVLDIEPIIIGIGYKNAYLMDSLRIRDYTYPKAPPSDSLPISGGGKHFYDFVKTEVLPYIDKHYRTDPENRTIMGHSFGGYFVSLTLLNDLMDSATFDNYIAASPSLWFSNGYIVEQFDSTSSFGENANNLRLFLTSGEEELQFGNEHYFKSFEESITKLRSVKIDSKVYPHLDHMGAAIPSFEDAIISLFGNKKPAK